jgi:glycine dehydrogenase subunit 2
MIVKKYFEDINEKRTKILIPDSAHGTNPASVTLCGFECVEVKSNSEGEVDLADLKSKLDKDVAAIMITNPNTLGLFERKIFDVTRMMHENGSLVYMDGANLNAMVGIVKPGDFGIDILHSNLHKTFSTPHGGGGPGAGPVGVKKHLAKFLPKPRVEFVGGEYKLNFDLPESIGRVRAFYGNFGILVRAYTYIRSNGWEGIRAIGENAVLNANYLLAKLKNHYHVAYNRTCQHEFVLTDKNLSNGVTTADLAKRLLDYGVYAPTIYFPLIVHGAIMIEPTETESKETLDRFAEIMIKIKEESEKEPELVKAAPLTTPVSRLDGVLAARHPVLKFEKEIVEIEK